MKFQWQMWPIERSQGCPFIWPLDLVNDPRWPTYELGLEIIKVYILIKYHEVLMTNVAYREVTSLSLYLTPWPNYWPQMTHVRTWPRNHQGLHADQISWSSVDKCGLQRGHKFYMCHPPTHPPNQPTNQPTNQQGDSYIPPQNFVFGGIISSQNKQDTCRNL